MRADRLRDTVTAALAASQTIVDAYVADHHALFEANPVLAQAGETREVAVWELSGYCLVLENVILDMYRHAYSFEVAPMVRALAEELSLIMILPNRDEPEPLRAWLADENIPHAKVARSLGRLERRLRDAGYDVGADQPPIRNLYERLHKVYSPGAHGTRSHVRALISPDGFRYSPPGDPFWHGLWAIQIAVLTQLDCQAIHHALHATFGVPGDNSWKDREAPLKAAIRDLSHALRDELDARARSSGGATEAADIDRKPGAAEESGLSE